MRQWAASVSVDKQQNLVIEMLVEAATPTEAKSVAMAAVRRMFDEPNSPNRGAVITAEGPPRYVVHEATVEWLNSDA